MTDEQAMDPGDRRSFPGGRVRLPMINPSYRSNETEMAIVGTAFVRAPEQAPIDDAPKSGFTGYFTYESLFEEPEADETTEVRDNPYAILRLRPDCTWGEVMAAHRHLAKEFHPDRFAEHDDDVIRQAEHEIRRINLAFAELRQTHPDAH